MPPKPGDTVTVGKSASVQFADGRSIRMQLISVGQPITCDGFAWVTGYVIGSGGAAIGRREVFVRLAGLRRAKASQRRRAPE
jgi:hypothetical protein